MAIEALTNARVLICSEDPFDTQQIENVVELGGMINLGYARDGGKAVHSAISKRPEIVIMDGRLKVYNGVLAASMIVREYPACVFLLLARSDLDLRMDSEQNSAVAGFVLKPIDPVSFLYQLGDAYEEFRATHGPGASPLGA